MVEAYDADGNLIEGVMSAEEVQQKIESEKSELADKITEISTQLETASTEAANAKAELEKISKTDKNWNTARKAKDEADEKVKQLSEKVQSLEGQLGTIAKQTEEKELNQAINLMAGGDPELAKKISHHYSKFAKPENEEQKQELLRSAFVLATGGKPAQAPSGGAFGSGSGSGNPAYDIPKEGGQKLSTPEASEVGQKMGLTPEEQKQAGLV